MLPLKKESYELAPVLADVKFRAETMISALALATTTDRTGQKHWMQYCVVCCTPLDNKEEITEIPGCRDTVIVWMGFSENPAE